VNLAVGFDKADKYRRVIKYINMIILLKKPFINKFIGDWQLCLTF